MFEICALSAVCQSDALLHAKGMVLKAKKEILMETQLVYEDVRAKAETLSPEELSRLIGELSRFL